METSPSSRLDAIDRQLIAQLQDDGRLSYNELARRVHLSPPAVAERVRRLEQSGVITGYAARVDPTRAGHPLLAFIHKLSGEFCTMLKPRAGSLLHLEGLVERLGTHGELRTHIVLSTQFDGRPGHEVPAARTVEQSAGWRSPVPGEDGRDRSVRPR